MDKSRSHPYAGLPDNQFWKRSFDASYVRSLDPVSNVKFKITQSTKIVTAGSCFAQNLARHIVRRGFNFLITERVHGIFVEGRDDDAHARTFNYDNFTARYGNIYTARQLRQLVERAYGEFEPLDDHWRRADGRFVDPFRPQVEPGGFIDARELRLDREHHFAAVREAIENAEVFVFTLGLTEAWRDRRDGAVYPLAPGVAGGRYDPAVHEFVNFTVETVHSDMILAFDAIRRRNPDIKFLLTVSPVPLNATYEPRHVLQSTIYSKSVLRVASQMLTDAFGDVDYFPSYEIIVSPQCSGLYYEDDRRSVREYGVKHVMRVFFENYADSPIVTAAPTRPAATAAAKQLKEMERLVRVLCDEEAIDNSPAAETAFS